MSRRDKSDPRCRIRIEKEKRRNDANAAARIDDREKRRHRADAETDMMPVAMAGLAGLPTGLETHVPHFVGRMRILLDSPVKVAHSWGFPAADQVALVVVFRGRLCARISYRLFFFSQIVRGF